MALTASMCDASHIMSINNVSAHAILLRLTMLQIYLTNIGPWPKLKKKGRSGPQPCTVYMCRPNYTIE